MGNNAVLSVILTFFVLIILLNIGLSLFSGFNTEANYNTIPESARSTYDLVPTVFGFAIVLVVIILILGIIGLRGG